MRFGVCGTMLGRDSFRPSAIRRKIYSTMLGGLKTPPANAATLSRVPFYPSDTVFAFGDPGEELVLFCFHLSSVFEQALGHFDVPHAGSHYNTPLHWACQENRLDIIGVLMSRNADVGAISRRRRHFLT